MLDRGADRLRARIMGDFGKEPADARCLACEPVAARAGGFGVARNWRLDRDRIRRRARCAGAGAEVGAFQGAATAFDATRDRTARALRRPGAITHLAVARQGPGIALHDLQPRPPPPTRKAT